MIDKNGILPQIQKLPRVVLDLGCGPSKINKECIGIDLLDLEGVDLVGDIYEVIDAFPDKSVDEIYSHHFFEHVQDVRGLLSSLCRVLKLGGKIIIVVPHFSNPYYYSDYTHKNFFGLYTLSYLVKDEYLHRKVPHYDTYLPLKIEKINLRFKSPFYLTYGMRQLWQLFFNSSVLLKEWYEDAWSGIFPCYEIQYILIKDTNLRNRINGWDR